MRANVPTPSAAAQLLRTRIGKICVAIIGSTAAEMIEKATAVVKETPFLEFRLDYLEKPLAALPKFKQFFADNTAATGVATCRRSANGGKFSGTLASEMEILVKAAHSGFHLVDLELESAESLKKGELQKLRDAGVGLIISHHDFAATKDLDKIYERIEPFHADFVKIVPTAKHLVDNVTLIRFIERMNESANIIGICMGDAGIISRVLGLRAGSVFTFAAATSGEETGPGQIAGRTLMETYRIDQVDAATKVYGVAGNPIKSSLSPVMMNTAFRRETVNAVANRAGDRCWPMPLYDEYVDQMRSEIADLVNSGGRAGGACTAAGFLREFTGGLPWAHLDIAGTAWADEAKPFQPKGPIGVAVRTLAELPFTYERW